MKIRKCAMVALLCALTAVVTVVPAGCGKSTTHEGETIIWDSDAPEATTQFTVRFISDEETLLSVKIAKNALLKEPQRPDKPSTSTQVFEFGGWYNGESKWDFTKDTVQSDLLLTAKWIVAEDYTKEYLPSD